MNIVLRFINNTQRIRIYNIVITLNTYCLFSYLIMEICRLVVLKDSQVPGMSVKWINKIAHLLFIWPPPRAASPPVPAKRARAAKPPKVGLLRQHASYHRSLHQYGRNQHAHASRSALWEQGATTSRKRLSASETVSQSKRAPPAIHYYD